METIPHAPGIENAVVSVLLKWPEKLDEAPNLSAEHFHQPSARRIFELAADDITANRQPDLSAMLQKLHDSGELDSIGGPVALADLIGAAPNNMHFAGHIRILSEKLALRSAWKLSVDLREALESGMGASEVSEMASATAQIVCDAISEAAPAQDTKALLRASAVRWGKLANGEVDPMGIETSIPEINQLFRGLKPGRVTVISGLPSEGKSLLGGQLFMDAAQGGNAGLFLTWEMSESELLDRFLAYEARLPFDAITDPIRFAREVDGKNKPTELHVQKARSAYRKIGEYPISIQAMHGQNITQAISAIRRCHRKSPLSIVAMDFIQRIPCARSMERQSYERQLTDVADRFQNLAQELGFHGLLLSQLNKEGGAKHAEAINESCALHLKIVNARKVDAKGVPIMDSDGEPIILAQGLSVSKDRFNGQTGRLLPVGLNKQIQRFERLPD
jgi:replicative DNA helicase